MDELLRIFLSWNFMIFCLGLAAFGFVLRKVVEYLILDNPHIPASKQSPIWRSLILPVAPVLTGALAGYFAKGYPYPEGLSTSEYGRVSFGLVAGLLSGLVYRVVNELLRSKIAQGNVITPYPDQSTSNVAQPPVAQSVQISINKDPVIPNIPSVDLTTGENNLDNNTDNNSNNTSGT